MIENIMSVADIVTMSWVTGTLMSNIFVMCIHRKEVHLLEGLYKGSSPTERFMLYPWVGVLLCCKKYMLRGRKGDK